MTSWFVVNIFYLNGLIPYELAHFGIFDMKKKLILHVGTHKTGSTSLQHFLLLNKDYLLSQGIFYPTTKYHPVGQQRLAYAFNEQVSPHLSGIDSEVKDVFDEFNRVVNNTLFSHMIISSENFAPGGDVSVIAKIKEFFFDYDVDVLIYLRRQDKYLQSIYRECVKLPNSFSGRFDEFKSPHSLNYYEIINSWQSVFGINNVIVKSYDYAVRVDGGIVQSFSNCFPEIKDSLEGFYTRSSQDNSNETLSNIALELIRAGNFSDISMAARGNFNKHIRHFVKDSGLDDVWDFELPSDFMNGFSKINKKISEDFFCGEDHFSLSPSVVGQSRKKYLESDIYGLYMDYSRDKQYYKTHDFKVFSESVARNFSIQ